VVRRIPRRWRSRPGAWQPASRRAAAQTAAGRAASGKDNPAYYELQRSTQIDRYHVAAKSGVGRGETLYYYKC